MRTSREKRCDTETVLGPDASPRKTAGVVVVEYAFLLVFFCVPVMLASAALGITMIKGYGEIRNDLLHVGP
jgi:hypothetical protein